MCVCVHIYMYVYTVLFFTGMNEVCLHDFMGKCNMDILVPRAWRTRKALVTAI